ncbi:hypothetical protein [Nonomuraea basaltis]|uniref:hypothetical protein n=1 Tax=Nonomuraea basaltis TaxID=2495887 RepID=UPI00110C6057|nr:hypothetical protein [Nonomuraea basaltis]TMR99556.1 hypothetical protein EJK15_07015 [Nonomuraea basaltis]
MTINLNADGSIDLTAIDYTTETGPYWVVFVDNTAVNPDWPLPIAWAAHEWKRLASRALETRSGARVELVQCTHEELELVPVPGGRW